MMKNQLLLTVITVLCAMALTACAADTAQEVAGVPAQPSPTTAPPASKAVSHSPLALESPLSPLAPPVPPEARAAFRGISFRYDTSLAAAVVPATVPAEPFMSGEDVIPEHVTFSFQDYALADTLHQPRIYVYPVSEFQATSQAAAGIIAAVRDVLAAKPESPEGIPILPLFNARQMMRAHVAYLDFQGGSGVRFLTQYDQAYLPINNHEFFYTFQGITDDGMYYVSAVLPVSHPTLPPDASETIEGDMEAFIQNFDAIMRDTEAQIDAQDAATFAPNLSVLDAMIASLSISAAPATELQDITAGWGSYKNPDYGFAFRYPPVWVLQEEPNLLTLKRDDLSLAIAYQRPMQDVTPASTGLPAGQSESRGDVSLLGQTVPKTAIVYQGKVKVLAFGGIFDNLQLTVRLDDLAPDYANSEIPANVQAELDLIATSFERTG